MKKTFALLALVVSLSTLVAGYPMKVHSSQENASDREKVVELTREFVSQNFSQDVAIVQDGMVDPKTGYRVAVINRNGTGTIEAENIRVSFEGERALATGRVIFKGQLPNGKSYRSPTKLSVEYEKRDGRWQFVSGGVSSASEK
ncbi:MAG: hypothetical protein WKF30_06480 [Pyrinomonadaceae bacterium]